MTSALAAGATAAVRPVAALGQSGSTVSFTVDANQSLARVPRLAFGANLLATRDDLRGTYGARIGRIAPTLLRWPGGEISHDLLTTLGTVNRDYVTQLWPFLHYCHDNGIAPVIVVPSSIPRDLTPSAFRRAARTLVRNVTDYLPDPKTRIIWEFDNETYTETGADPDRYAADLAVLRQILDYWRPRADGFTDLVAVVAGAATRRVTDWAEPLGSVIDKTSYDLLAFHSYPSDHLIYTLPHLETARQFLGDKPALISEWNHYSCWNPAWGFPGGNCVSEEDFLSRTYGQSLAGAMVSHFAQMLTYDIHGAAFWAVQQNDMASQWPNEGLLPGQDPYVTGAVFSWLTETKDMDCVSIQQTPVAEEPACFAFADDDRMLLFVDARATPAETIEIDIRNYSFSAYWGRRLSGENDVRSLIPADLPARAVRFGSRIRVPARLEKPYELIRINLQR